MATKIAAEKSGASFEAIAGVIGSILIATGVAWLIAQNWHQIPSVIKIIILLAATAGAYASGIVLRVKDYPKVSKALLILGSLFYTLSIFLIAQIFFTGGSTQGIAWLWFISLIGVLASSYLLESGEILGVGIIEFIIWVAVQTAAFSEGCGYGNPEGACFALTMPFFLAGIALGVSAASIYIGSRTGRILGILGAIGIFIFSSFFSGGFVAIIAAIILIPVVLILKNPENTLEGIKLCKGLLSSLIIFWVSLILIHPSTLQGAAFVMFLASGVAFSLGYYLKSKGSIFLSFIELISAVLLQYYAFLAKSPVATGVLAVYLLEFGILFYGLSLLHRAKNHEFAKIYVWWTAFYMLAFSYLASFQFSLPALWAIKTEAKAPIVFMAFLLLVAAGSVIYGARYSAGKKAADKKEIAWFAALVILLSAVIGSASFVSNASGWCYVKSCYEYSDKASCTGAPSELKCRWDNNYCDVKSCYDYRNETSCQGAPSELKCKWDNNYCINDYYPEQEKTFNLCNSYNNNQEACAGQELCRWQSDIFRVASPPGAGSMLWTLWIFANIVFISVILAVIGYGTLYRMADVINLGIVFFALEIVTRYIGFIQDYWGYTSLSLIFISGGIILIGGGVLIERWRKKLISQAKSNTKG